MQKLKRLIAGLLIFTPMPSFAAPYFRILKPLDEVKTGAFIKIGTPNDNIAYGFQTTLIKHRAEDGYLLLPGVSWSLLDIGGAKTDSGSLSAILGPSVDLSEPVKSALLSAIRAVSPDGLGSVKAVLAPAVAGKACLAASMGPGLSVDLGPMSAARDIKGSLVLHLGLSARW